MLQPKNVLPKSSRPKSVLAPDHRIAERDTGRQCKVRAHDTQITCARIREKCEEVQRRAHALEFGDERDVDALEFGADDNAALDFGADLDVALEFGADN